MGAEGRWKEDGKGWEGNGRVRKDSRRASDRGFGVDFKRFMTLAASREEILATFGDDLYNFNYELSNDMAAYCLNLLSV